MVKLKVTGMSCEHCVGAVKQALAGVEGVDEVVAVDLETGDAIVDGQPDTSALIAAIEEEGYSAELAP